MMAAMLLGKERITDLTMLLALLPFFPPLSLSFLTWNGIRIKPDEMAEKFHTAGTVPTFVMLGDLDIPKFSMTGASLLTVPNAYVPRGLTRSIESSWSSAYAIPGEGRMFLLDEKGAPAGAAHFISDDLHDIVIETDAEVPATLVLRDIFYPGWEASVDSSRAEIRLAEGCFRAVAVPVSKHAVRFAYLPKLVYLTGGASALCTVAVLLLALFARGGAGRMDER